MLTISHASPFQLPIDSKSYSGTLRQYVDEIGDFVVPTVCVNLRTGQPVMREQWELVSEGEYTFISAPEGIETLLVALAVTAVAAAAFFLFMPSQAAQENAPEAFTLAGMRNDFKLNQPIESHYGRKRIFPTKISEYARFEGNEQFLHTLLCLGHGKFESEGFEVLFEDTPVSNFSDVQTQVINPGESLTLFNPAVSTSSEATNLELKGENDEGTWIGPFTASPTGTLSTKLEVDLTLPMGLFRMSSRGKIRDRTVVVEFQYRQIGTEDWLTLHNLNLTASDNKPRRFTFSVNVPPCTL